MALHYKSHYTAQEIEHCVAILRHLAEHGEDFALLSETRQIELMKIAGQLSRPDRYQAKQRTKAFRKVKKQVVDTDERKARAATGIRRAREQTVFSAPAQLVDATEDPGEERILRSPRNCYICKAEFTRLHFFYDTLCPQCAALNYQKRFQTGDLRGQVALITGSRLKIGYQATLMMLRAGAMVVATTRFPHDAALRYAREKDFGEWGDRLHIYGLDLRHTPSVEIFCRHIAQRFNRLDILINNAAQTVRRPPGFYAHLMANETKSLDELLPDAQKLLIRYAQCTAGLHPTGSSGQDSGSALPVAWHGALPGIGLREPAKLSQVPYVYDDSTALSDAVFPKGKLDADLQQVDMRTTNSWRLKLGEISTVEMLELQLVNAVAPFVLCNSLSPLMIKDFTGQ